ncbi:hypothetical protein RIB2604_02901960 [Aspergillus luchuensis]|uniref:Uncharacterized protein n=1 Tax=Aspergillus kawachii TaxID=1069201 RepID=A0A146FUW3_ASPKA|nr:hypothetical protein RIB2604_02901960 [Aspergillus luchuensis]
MSQLPKSRRLLFIKVVDLDRNEIVTIRRPASSTRFESRDQLCDRVCDPTKDLTCRPTWKGIEGERPGNPGWRARGEYDAKDCQKARTGETRASRQILSKPPDDSWNPASVDRRGRCR